ncbi:lipoprotein [Skermanella stibiiresistens]|nr:lipoprotein [Skermanella stibiiresistens]
MRRAILAAVAAVFLAACATPIDVGVKGGSASQTRWKVGIPF